MSANAVATATPLERPRTAASPRVRSRFYVWLGLWMLAIVVIGFWPTYFSPLLRGTLAIPTVVHAHALVFLGWMTLLIAQVIVAAQGNIRLHRRIGRWGIAYGCVVIVMGADRGTGQRSDQAQCGRVDSRSSGPIAPCQRRRHGLVCGLFGAAIWYRARPEIHKRLMVVATVVLLFAALARWTFIGSGLARFGIWLSPIFVGMVHDWITRRRIHPVYTIGSIALFLFALRLLAANSQPWLRIGRPIIDALR